MCAWFIVGLFLFGALANMPGAAAVFTAPSTSPDVGSVSSPHCNPTVFGEWGASTQYNYNAPANDAHPQYFSAIEAKESNCGAWISLLKITLWGYFPNGTLLPPTRFQAMQTYVSPQDSGSTQYVMAFIDYALNLDPYGLGALASTILNLATQSGNPIGVTQTVAWGQWSSGGGSTTTLKGLMLAWMLAVDTGAPGKYQVYVTYNTTFQERYYCGRTLCILSHSTTKTDALPPYCYLACDPPLANGAAVASVSPPPAGMDASPGSYYHTATVSVSMQNTGTTTWYPVSRPSSDVPVSCADCYTDRLALISPANAGFSPTRIDLPAGRDVGPGQSVTFSFTLTASQTQAFYYLQWQMVREPGTGGSPSTSTFFGAATAAYGVNVLADFLPSASLCGVTLYNTGMQTTCSISVTSSHTWSGTVTFSSSVSPTGGVRVVSIAPSSVTLAANGVAAATLTLNGGTTTGYYTVYVTATSGSIVRTTSFVVSITVPPPPHGGCVAFGTPILTYHGYVPVQALKPGDTVMEFDFAAQRLVPGTLVSAVVSWEDRVVIVNGGALVLTLTDQPIYVVHGATVGWLRDPQNLTVGDRIFDAVHDAWVPVWSVQIVQDHVRVYDVVTSGANNFIANGFLLDIKIQ